MARVKELAMADIDHADCDTIDYVDHNIGVQWANEILKKTNEPMSIDQIKAKFDPLYPFTVRVARSVAPDSHPNGTPTQVVALPLNTLVTITGFNTIHNWYECLPVLGHNVYWIHPSLEKWVLV